MNINDHNHSDFSLANKDTIPSQHVTKAAQTGLVMEPRGLKKTRLERLSLSGTTSALMRIIRKVRVERLPEYFEQTCDWRQDETAVICGSSQLTYQELDERANRLAHLLISRGVEKNDPVGILLERSLDTYIALLGVLKAGAAFVPLDPSFSADNVALIAKDAGLRDLVTISTFRAQTNLLDCSVLELDQAYDALSIQHKSRLEIRVNPTSLCYIIYTLSPTGQPKGLAVSHANIVNFLHVATPIYGLMRTDRVYQGMSIAFDLSFEEIWSTWIAGATLVAAPPDFQYSGRQLTAFLIEHKITVLRCIPTLLAIIESDIPSLRFLLLGGETCPDYLISQWSRPGRRLLNTYGPAETTITATWCELFPGRPVTIGSPLPTYYIYILDDQFRSVEDGERGEICIGGPGVAMGYLNHPSLTQKRFIPNPILHDREIAPHLYCTGDFGRLTPSGEIEYLGHMNAQIETRNYRNEFGELQPLALAWTASNAFDEATLASQLNTSIIPTYKTDTTKTHLLDRINIASMYNHIMTDPLYRNSLFNMASTFILGGLGFVFWIIIARLYRTENVGIATTLISIMTLVSSFTILGLSSSLIRYLPKSTNKNELINSSFMVVTLVTIISCVIFLMGLQVFSPQLLFLRSNIFYSVSFTIFIIFCSWNVLVESIFVALRTAGNILIKNSIISISKLLLPFVLVALGAYGIFISTALALAIGVFASLATLILHFKIRFSVSVNVSLLKETSVYSFANYTAGFMFNMPSLVLPVIILNQLSAKYAAYYYIASMIQNILLVIPLATAQSLLTEGSYNEAKLRKHVKKAITTILVLLLPATAIIVFGGNTLLQFFGKSYASEALQFLQIYSISTIFTALILIANAIMNVKHQTKSLVVSNTLASIITLWLSYAFISGKLIGIGWGWILGQAIAGLLSLSFILWNSYMQKNRSR